MLPHEKIISLVIRGITNQNYKRTLPTTRIAMIKRLITSVDESVGITKPHALPKIQRHHALRQSGSSPNN